MFPGAGGVRLANLAGLQVSNAEAFTTYVGIPSCENSGYESLPLYVICDTYYPEMTISSFQ